MAGNSQRRGAMRNPGSKKGATVGSGGQRRKALQGKGPTPKATERPHHPAARRERAVAKRAATAKPRSATPPKRSSARSDAATLIGRNSVVEALRARIPAKALYLQARVEADDRWREAIKLAVAQNIPVLEVIKTDLDRMSDGGVHQGMALVVPPYEYAELEDIAQGSLIVALDGVTDPRNLGAVVRSAAAFGANGVVIPERRSAGVTAGAWKTSAGALTRVPVAQVTNLTRALTALKKQGYAVVGLAADGDRSIDDMADVLSDAVVIVVGSEGEGLSRLVKETCDWVARIDMQTGNESLNASVATGIALHSVYAARD